MAEDERRTPPGNKMRSGYDRRKDQDALYEGVERRSGKERRSGRDRRKRT